MNAESQLCLRDGRRVDINRVEIAQSMAGFLEGDPARIWDIVLKESSRVMESGGGRAYVVTPVFYACRPKLAPGVAGPREIGKHTD